MFLGASSLPTISVSAQHGFQTPPTSILDEHRHIASPQPLSVLPKAPDLFESRPWLEMFAFDDDINRVRRKLFDHPTTGSLKPAETHFPKNKDNFTFEGLYEGLPKPIMEDEPIRNPIKKRKITSQNNVADNGESDAESPNEPGKAEEKKDEIKNRYNHAL